MNHNREAPRPSQFTASTKLPTRVRETQQHFIQVDSPEIKIQTDHFLLFYTRSLVAAYETPIKEICLARLLRGPGLRSLPGTLFADCVAMADVSCVS